MNDSSCSHSPCLSASSASRRLAQVVASELTDLPQEAEVPLLHLGASAGALEDLDHALRALVVVHGGEHQQVVGRVRGGVLLGVGDDLAVGPEAGVRLDDRPLIEAGPGGGREHPVQQASVLLLGDRVLRQAGLAEVDLVAELELTRVGNGPNGSAVRLRGRRPPC